MEIKPGFVYKVIFSTAFMCRMCMYEDEEDPCGIYVCLCLSYFIRVSQVRSCKREGRNGSEK